MARQEIAEIRRRSTNDAALKRRSCGLTWKAAVRMEHRFDWVRRYTTAVRTPGDSDESLEVR